MNYAHRPAVTVAMCQIYELNRCNLVGMLNIIGQVPILSAVANEIVKKRKAMGLSQTALAKRARISRSTLDALENGRMGELGYTKINNLLAALGLELKIQEAVGRRPTLEELLNEEHDD